MRLFRKRIQTVEWDREAYEPAIQKSICTGEETFGFISRADGRFHGLEALRSADDRAAMCERYGIKPEEMRTIF